jgi:membrane protease YdiL (CAAX protease family)
MREPILVWTGVILALAATQLAGLAIPFIGQLTGALAVAAFLYVPSRMLERRGEDATDAGLRFDRLPADLAWSLGTSAVILPLFALAFAGFGHLPEAARAWLTPYVGVPRWHAVPITLDVAGAIAGNGAVALSEEFFYRGYMTRRFEERTTPVRAALLAAAFFAAGHLLRPAPFRLAVFFPALWFAFLRNRTGTVIGAWIAHWLANVALLLLERAAY